MADPALSILAEALARVEHKLDLLLLKTDAKSPMPMHFMGHTCPVCNQLVDYQVDLTHNVVKRVCGCKTGKQPSLIPLVPIPGVINGSAAGSAAGRSDSPAPAEDSSVRKGSKPSAG